MEEEIQLMIKAPNQNIEDFPVNCSLSWTVKELKEFLSQRYPNKPAVLEQRIIYSGRLLLNHLHLRDILRHEEGEPAVHTLHLVCKANSYTPPSQNSSFGPACSLNPASEQPRVLMERSNTSELRSSSESPSGQRMSSVDSSINSMYSQPQNPVTVIPPLTDNAQVLAQVAAMQQMYAYYMNQYMQSMNAAATINNPLSSSEPQSFPPNANETPLQRPLNQRINAQAGQVVEENEEAANRDWLDHLFHCCRFLILFSILYFYSTPERLMIVIVCAVIAFLYHEGWFVRRTRPVQVAPEVLVPRGNRNNLRASSNETNEENNPALVNQELSANEELHDGHELEAAMDGEDPPHVQNADAANNNNQIFSPLTFLSAFFASLIPEPPPPVNIN